MRYQSFSLKHSLLCALITKRHIEWWTMSYKETWKISSNLCYPLTFVKVLWNLCTDKVEELIFFYPETVLLAVLHVQVHGHNLIRTNVQITSSSLQSWKRCSWGYLLKYIKFPMYSVVCTDLELTPGLVHRPDLHAFHFETRLPLILILQLLCCSSLMSIMVSLHVQKVPWSIRGQYKQARVGEDESSKP